MQGKHEATVMLRDERPRSRPASLEDWGPLRIRGCSKRMGPLTCLPTRLRTVPSDRGRGYMCLGVIGNQDRRSSYSFLPPPSSSPFSSERYNGVSQQVPFILAQTDKSASYAADPSSKPPWLLTSSLPD